MGKFYENLWWILKITAGSVLFALGFDLFLAPNGFNAGGLSGVAQILVHILGFGSVGIVSGLVNLLLFIFCGMLIVKFPIYTEFCPPNPFAIRSENTHDHEAQFQTCRICPSQAQGRLFQCQDMYLLQWQGAKASYHDILHEGASYSHISYQVAGHHQ